jgi:hypothetical protein
MLLAAAQKNGTQATVQAFVHFLNYCATHPDATLCYHASNMILHIHSNATYLNETKACIGIGGHLFLANQGFPINQPSDGPIHDIPKILKHGVASAAEAEIGATFLYGEEDMDVHSQK